MKTQKSRSLCMLAMSVIYLHVFSAQTIFPVTYEHNAKQLFFSGCYVHILNICICRFCFISVCDGWSFIVFKLMSVVAVCCFVLNLLAVMCHQCMNVRNVLHRGP